jgi:hypothetical protein
MGKGQILFISVEGSDEAITEGLKAFQSGLNLIQRSDDQPAPIALPVASSGDGHHIVGANKIVDAEVRAAANGTVRRGAVKRAVQNVRKAVRTPKARKVSAPAPVPQPAFSLRAGGGDFTCPECGDEAKTCRGLGVHRRRSHGVVATGYIPKAQRVTAKPAAVKPQALAQPATSQGGFGCTECDQSFLSATLRDRHLKDYHPEVL